MEDLETFSIGMKVLLVDYDNNSRLDITRMMQSFQYEVIACPRAETALMILDDKKGEFDVVVIDANLPDMDGLDLLKLILPKYDVSVMMMSAYTTMAIMMQGLEFGAYLYFTKPLQRDDIRSMSFAVYRKKMGPLEPVENQQEENLEVSEVIKEEEEEEEDENLKVSEVIQAEEEDDDEVSDATSAFTMPMDIEP